MSGFGSSIEILIIDDHTLFCEALRSTLEVEEDFTVVGTVKYSSDVAEKVQDVQPDIIIMDAVLPGRSVMNRIADIQKVAPASSVIMLTMWDDPILIRQLLAQTSVCGYLLKSTTRLMLVAAIRAIRADGNRIIVSATSMHFKSEGRRVLSDRECMVLELVAEGLSNGQIASKLCIAEATVKRHLRNSYTKLGAVSRVDAVNKAVSASIIEVPDFVRSPLGMPAGPQPSNRT
ncbi:response regulator transcription factor [Streptomyces sp. NPDC050560]|uniref:response regulator transcription factor n=1 Tax=Streptomyces sp. NPDC050560 TaxID=3365630 RepID=UPI0037A919C9